MAQIVLCCVAHTADLLSDLLPADVHRALALVYLLQLLRVECGPEQSGEPTVQPGTGSVACCLTSSGMAPFCSQVPPGPITLEETGLASSTSSDTKRPSLPPAGAGWCGSWCGLNQAQQAPANRREQCSADS
jgi:hypothetical protein